MIDVWIIVILIGLASVAQGGLNKIAGQNLSLPSALFINGAVFFAASATYYFVTKRLSAQPSTGSWSWWIFIPGLLGFAFVLGVPIAIEKLGSTRVFIGLIAAQVAGGIAWDYFVESNTVSIYQILGAFLSIIGCFLVAKSGS